MVRAASQRRGMPGVRGGETRCVVLVRCRQRGREHPGTTRTDWRGGRAQGSGVCGGAVGRDGEAETGAARCGARRECGGLR
eukprot:3203202-Prymnesium_polylepis.1